LPAPTIAISGLDVLEPPVTLGFPFIAPQHSSAQPSRKVSLPPTFHKQRPEMKFPSAVAYIVCMPTPARSKKKSARVLSSRLVYKGPVFWVTSERVQEPSGVRVLREVVRHTGSVVVLATRENRREPLVLLERQYRHAAESYLWELPAGRIDKGETALAAAKRELLEETGYTAKRWKRILNFFASPGFVAETMTVFWAQGLTSGPAQPEPDEVIEQRLVPLSKAVRMIQRGTIRDAKTISSVLWLALHRKGVKSR
jgi:ADP-ribose pyrophosphatase